MTRFAITGFGGNYAKKRQNSATFGPIRKYGIFPQIAVLALSLAACNHNQPGVEVRTVEVVKLEQAPCPATRPERPAPLGKLPEHAQAALAKALAALAAYSAPGMYADQAEAWFDACATEE